MALCSTIFNNSVKRNCNSNYSSKTKRVCIKDSYKFPANNEFSNNMSSDDEDENSDDEQLCYKLNQIKAKRRASNRVSFSLNPNLELSKLISRYSDDEDENKENVCDDINNNVGKTTSPGNRASINSVKSDDNLINNHFKFGNSIKLSNFNSNQDETCKIIQIPKADKLARSRCFEYLIGAIDEAWARYCDATSCLEGEVFYNDDDDKENIYIDSNKFMNPNKSSYSACNAVNRKFNDDENDLISRKDSDDDYEIIDDYSMNSTDLTDVSDYSTKRNQINLAKRKSVNNQSSSSNKFKCLKDRLTKAKYYLQDLVVGDNYQDILNFWNRWDLIKYCTIELVEDDDDDEVIESTIEELENGRYFVN